MPIPQQIAKHVREVYFGGNWTTVNLRDSLIDVTWQQSTTQIRDFNTILALTYHVTYYVAEVLKVLEGGPLTASDKLSYSHPPVANEADWQALQQKAWADAEQFADLVEQLPEQQLTAHFTDEKYGNYYRNLHGIIEHLHYHLGQIVILKKLVQQP